MFPAGYLWTLSSMLAFPVWPSNWNMGSPWVSHTMAHPADLVLFLIQCGLFLVFCLCVCFFYYYSIPSVSLFTWPSKAWSVTIWTSYCGAPHLLWDSISRGGGLGTVYSQWRFIAQTPMLGGLPLLDGSKMHVDQEGLFWSHSINALNSAQHGSLLTNNLLGFFHMLFRLLIGIGEQKAREEWRTNLWFPLLCQVYMQYQIMCPKAFLKQYLLFALVNIFSCISSLKHRRNP